ncbi:CDP-alcohol phosphatidyltransferase family protein [Candidatus Raskinella chloraquaticus]|uniref:CDP-diacylglycerol--glycerol-3-phosphate 3-phosphatidyltransferase n=1 Tax=Candidatus Raskinella chloraquaticus TaxID=1951219 RepID=A0A1W9HVV0_9HYPH|nr:MAG: hypothetical protein A4S15_11410 [Proteobacteria bacterium SG_bin8]
MNLPNALTLGRLLAVPIVVWLIAAERFDTAFWCFAAAGVTDAIDGYLARRLNQITPLGAYLDALADKLLLMSIYVTLAAIGDVPLWLAILIVFRDVMILGAVVLAWLLERPMTIAPLFISKVNTTAQIVVAGLVLLAHGFSHHINPVLPWMFAGCGLLTALSLAAYLAQWMQHMSGNGIDPPESGQAMR